MPDRDRKADTPEEKEEREQPSIGTDPMRAPQNRKERKIVAPNPDKVNESPRSD